jgi:hypothetical protein
MGYVGTLSADIKCKNPFFSLIKPTKKNTHNQEEFKIYNKL